MKQNISKEQWDEITKHQKAVLLGSIPSINGELIMDGDTSFLGIGQMIEFLGDEVTDKGATMVKIEADGKRPCYQYRILLQAICPVEGKNCGFVQKDGLINYDFQIKEKTIWGRGEEIADALWEAVKIKLCQK